MDGRFAGFLLASNMAKTIQWFQDIFTIRLIAIKYQNGVAASAVFRGSRRGAALRACGAQTARRSAGAIPPDSRFGGRTGLQTFRPPAARREVECGWQAI